MTPEIQSFCEAVDALISAPEYTPYYERKNLEDRVREHLKRIQKQDANADRPDCLSAYPWL